MNDDRLIIRDNRVKVRLPYIFKAGEENGKRVVYIEASNESVDAEGDVVMQQALLASRDHFLTNGVLSYDHLHKLEKDPKYIVGEPLDVKFTDEGHTYVKGWLYDENEYADSLYKLIRAGSTKVRASIGGQVMDRRGDAITDVQWDEVAFTIKPVNDSLVAASETPFKVFTKSFTKALDLKQRGLQVEIEQPKADLDYDDIVHDWVRNDRDTLKDKPNEHHDSLSLILDRVRSGKIKDCDQLLGYLNALCHTKLEARNIIKTLSNLETRLSYVLDFTILRSKKEAQDEIGNSKKGS